VAVYEKRAGRDNPLALEFGGLEDKPLVMTAKDGAFTVGVDEDERLMTRTIWLREETRFNSGAFEFSAMELGSVVVAEFADITRSKSPGLASDHGAGDLAARKNACRFKFDLGAASRILVERNERVRGIQTDSNNIHRGDVHL